RHVHAAGQLVEHRAVAVIADHQRRDLSRAGLRGRIKHLEPQPQRGSGKRQHAGQLPAPEDPDRGHRRGSSPAATVSVCCARKRSSAAPMPSSEAASMAAANRAALAAPAAPIANVATGTPAGICTIDSSESMPLSALVCTGTPSTGTAVLAAIIPGRWAAPPAPAMMAFRPRALALAAYSNITSGVRWAETTRT